MATVDELRAVGHPVRRRIIDHLSVNDAAQVGELATLLDQQVGSISHHLRILEREGFVERAPELATDGRTSWWRSARRTFSYSPDDFPEVADRHVARAVARTNFEHHVARFVEHARRDATYAEEWRRAATSTDLTARATAAELEALGAELTRVTRAWRDAIDQDDGQERRPVFVFAHSFPMEP